ncbi:MAG: transcriptional repressor [Chloroflexi bacterium]|nr:MAG: transcriptional repressor [Chloroflexota bacterium]
MQRLRDKGYRLTPQRMAILRAILSSRSHPTAEEIYQQVAAEFPMLSGATVYKTLNVLRELGEVLEIEVGGRSHYDANITPHPHLICVKCHRIMDLPPEAMVKLPEEFIAQTGFKVLQYYLEIYGLCSQCQEGGK